MKRALLIGINYIDASNITLNGCIDDALNMRNMLIDAYDYDSKDIIVLRDDSYRLTSRPTKNNIMQNLVEIINTSNENDEIIFHYSGHGTRIENIENITMNTGEKYDNVLVPLDYMKNGYIIDNDLFEIILYSKCPIFFIADCCHSGSMFDLRWSFEYKNKCTIERTAVMPRELDNKHIYALSGCTDVQTCSDVYSKDSKQYQGAFTNAVLACLRRNKHNVGILHLLVDIHEFLKAGKYLQTPVLTSSNKVPDYHFMRSISPSSINNHICNEIQIVDNEDYQTE
jgi:hypothetical protein